MHRLLAYARLQTEEDADVEMLLSAVIERVAEAVAKGRLPAEEEDLLRYSMRAIKHDAIRLSRRNRNRREAEQQYSAEGGPTPTDAHPRMEADDAEQRALLLRRAISCLPHAQAEVINLHIWQELSFAEIARRCGAPESTIRSRYAVALRAVKSQLLTLNLG